MAHSFKVQPIMAGRHGGEVPVERCGCGRWNVRLTAHIPAGPEVGEEEG